MMVRAIRRPVCVDAAGTWAVDWDTRYLLEEVMFFDPAGVRVWRPPFSGRESLVIALSDSKPREKLRQLVRERSYLTLTACAAAPPNHASRAHEARGDRPPASRADPWACGSCAAAG